MKRWAGAAAVTVLLGACAASAPSPSVPTYDIVMGVGGNASLNFGWLDVAPCTGQPQSWADAAAMCDLTKLRIILDPTATTDYNRGDTYPKPAKSAAPSGPA